MAHKEQYLHWQCLKHKHQVYSSLIMLFREKWANRYCTSSSESFIKLSFFVIFRRWDSLIWQTFVINTYQIYNLLSRLLDYVCTLRGASSSLVLLLKIQSKSSCSRCLLPYTHHPLRRKLRKAGFTHTDFISRLKVFKISSKIQAKIEPKSVTNSDFSKSEKSLHWGDISLEFAWRISKIGRQSWRV